VARKRQSWLSLKATALESQLDIPIQQSCETRGLTGRKIALSLKLLVKAFRSSPSITQA
jgi:hypothetical protein